MEKKQHILRTKQVNILATFFTLFALILIRFLYYGFQYFQLLDDYTQYFCYPAVENRAEFIKAIGLLAARPLAGLSDIFVWGKMYNHLIIAVIAISLLFAASAILFQSLFSKYFQVGIGFLIFYTLLPIGFEGTYWLSASTRIVCGLFWIAVSAVLLQNYIEKRKACFLLLSSIVQFIAFCYYEQILVLSITLNVLLLLINFKELKSKTATILISPVNAVLYFLFCNCFKSEIISGRSGIMLPTSNAYFNAFFPDILRQMKSAFIDSSYVIILRGFIRGSKQMISDHAVWYCLALMLLVITLYILSCSAEKNFLLKKTKLNIPLKIIVAVLLAIAPITPFFILEEQWFSMRGIVTSFLGLALLADFLLQAVSFKKEIVYRCICCGITFVFCVAAVSELTDYRINYQRDTQILSQIDKAADKPESDQRIGILNVSFAWEEDFNFFYHEHFSAITSSNWALTGGVRAYTQNANQAQFIPLFSYRPVYQDEADRKNLNLEGLDAIYYYSQSEQKLYPVSMKKINNQQYDFYMENGMRCAALTEIDGVGQIEILQTT